MEDHQVVAGPDSADRTDLVAFMQGGGRMGELMRGRDWSQSELGPAEHWPVALKSAISGVLNSGTAMHIAWGDRLLQFYNDAYAPVLTAGKHPAALGRSVGESFAEIWDFIEPLFDRVRLSGKPVAMENARLMMLRDRVLRESFFSFSYSPLKSLTGEVCGVTSVCWETTAAVITERRERGLHELNERLAAATGIAEVREAVERLVDGNRGDLPFVLWYERDEAQKLFRLVQACGLSPHAPLVRELVSTTSRSKLARALDARVPAARQLPLPAQVNASLLDAPADTVVDSIAVEPLCYVDYSTPDAYLVFAQSAGRPFNGASRNFHESICGAVVRAVRRISAIEMERREGLRRFDAVTGVVPSLVWMTDADGNCAFVSKRWLDFTGRTVEDSLGEGWMAGLHPDDVSVAAEARRVAAETLAPLDVTYRFRRADGQYRWMAHQGLPRYDECGKFVGMVGSSLDITERKALEDELLQLAAQDPLTGLPNRRRFRDYLLQVCEIAGRDTRPAALVFIDLDHFKTVNDSLTHEAGDVVLQEVSARLTDVVGSAGLIARLGGDEFAIVLPDHSAEEADAVAQRVAVSVALPFFVHSMEVFLTASIGVAMTPADAAGADELISCADLAMYEVKRRGRNGISRFVPQLRAAPASMLSLRGRMSRGLERDEFFTLFQPIASVRERRIVGAESLLRWRSSTGEMITPAVFIPAAEESGLIVPLSERMMTLAFAEAASWHREGRSLLMSVNLSARQLREPDICQRILAIAAEQGVSPGMVQLEITESVLMERVEQSERQLLQLKEMGFRIALDDFGTGYSSLAYLKNFPIDSIKIDGSFIRGLSRNVRDAAIVRTIINMSRDLGISTVAEGVETAAELESIAALGCDFYQGYLLARPIPGEQLAQLLD
ncbi:putative bifunctional diguanylate cyclase/phosphodiesterase [Cognatilysobacter lacus]|uniref:EAL domain-containing protein n=1 Tax=Cognatilysobacter lacus TaxID=1643323 RepID=A0A5D8Z7K4_9GAMM|nr:GGDEF and EAL domain-containing protein [Lysobacter lacus]TZF90789.1 EAL domain-containing protein [Lysobacter lacus]